MAKSIDTISSTPSSTPAKSEPTAPASEVPKEETKPTEAPKEEVKVEAAAAPEAKEEEKPAEPADATEASPEADSNSYNNMFPEPSVVIGSPPGWIWWAVLIIASLITAFIGFQLINGKINTWLSVNDSSASPTASATASPSATATADTTNTTTPSPAVTAAPTASSKSSITLRVLNGTTVTGAAAKAKNVLTAAGYTVRTVGNASNRSYQNTTIYYQAGNSANAALIKQSLTGYTSVLQESELAAPDMVLVVVGVN